MGFHLGDKELTIDLDRPLTEGEIVSGEALANEYVTRDLPVNATYPDADTLDSLPFRKRAAEVEGPTRVVEVPGVDLCTCCGTHCAHTGQVGPIKVVEHQRYKGGVRLTVLCGARALADYREKDRIVHALSARLSAKIADLPAALERVLDEGATLQRLLRQEQSALGAEIARRLYSGARLEKGCRVVVHRTAELSADEAKALAGQLMGNKKTVALVRVRREGRFLYYAVSGRETGFDARLIGAYLKDHCGAKGGGGKDLCQGSGDAAGLDALPPGALEEFIAQNL